MKQKSLLTTLILVLGLGAYTVLNTSYSGGFGGAYQPGGCSCHGSQSSATSVVINGLPTFYNTNTAYPISVTVTNSTKVAAGFQIKTNIGLLSTSDPGITVNTFAFNREAGHNSRKNMTSGTATFNLIWTSPSTGGTAATFDAAGNAVDNSFNNSGDQWNTAASSNVALPVDFVKISASQKKNSIELIFTTALEDNISHFEIQKSTNGLDFENIATKQSIGSGDYFYADFDLINGTTYFYRIKEVGIDNSFSLSEIATIKFKSESTLSIYPSIVENNLLNLKGIESNNLRFILFDFMGRKVFSTIAINTVELPQINSGIYFASIVSEKEIIKTQKIFIK